MRENKVERGTRRVTDEGRREAAVESHPRIRGPGGRERERESALENIPAKDTTAN